MQLRKHSERAAINTPLQGGAADVVVCAMLQLHRNERLKALGFKTLLQIHDEVILEGPKEAKDEVIPCPSFFFLLLMLWSSCQALDLVKKLMGRPFPEELLVDLVVDARAANTWLEAK
jgi:DNA polymerase I